MLKLKLAWLAGIVDGEGTITLCKISEDKGKGRHSHIRPIFQIVNTNCAMLQECQTILASITERKPNIKHKSFGKDAKRSHWKDSYVIQVTKQKDMMLICKTLIPYLITKKLQAELVIKFVEIRQSIIRKGRVKVLGGQLKPYGNGEESLYWACKYLNGVSSNNLESVETIRRTLLSEDIVRPVDINKTADLSGNRISNLL